MLIIYILNPAWLWDPDCAGQVQLPGRPGDVSDVGCTLNHHESEAGQLLREDKEEGEGSN